MTFDGEQASCRERTEHFVRLLLAVLMLADQWGPGPEGAALKRVILAHLEPHPRYDERHAADAFGMSLRRFRRKAKSLGLEPSGREEGARFYTWDRLIPHVERYWSERLRKGR